MVILVTVTGAVPDLSPVYKDYSIIIIKFDTDIVYNPYRFKYRLVVDAVDSRFIDSFR